MSAFKNYTGQKIGKLLITGRADDSDGGRTRWFADCDCGQKGVVILACKIAAGQHHCGCEFTGKSKKMRDTWKKRRENAAEHPIITAPQKVINDYLYKYRLSI